MAAHGRFVPGYRNPLINASWSIFLFLLGKYPDISNLECDLTIESSDVVNCLRDKIVASSLL